MVDIILGPVRDVRFGGSDDDGVVCVGFYMFLEVLGTLERLAAKVTLVRFERDMNTNVRSDVVTLDSGGAAVTPAAGQIEVVGALAANMAFAHMFLDTRDFPSQQGRKPNATEIESDGRRKGKEKEKEKEKEKGYTHIECLGGMKSFLATLPLADEALGSRRGADVLTQVHGNIDGSGSGSNSRLLSRCRSSERTLDGSLLLGRGDWSCGGYSLLLLMGSFSRSLWELS
jgi:hypothetical protein